MRFNVVVIDSSNKTYIPEFKHDHIIFLNKEKIMKKYNVVESDIEYFLRLYLISKYKNLIFIDTNNVCVSPDLRKEIVGLLKSIKADIFMSNVRDIKKNYIFVSRKCPSYIKKDVKSKNIIKSFLLKSSVCKIFFEKINWDFLPYEEEENN